MRSAAPRRCGRDHRSRGAPGPARPHGGTAEPLRCALASDCASTDHVWITVWRQHGLNPFRHLLAAHRINGIWAGNWGVAARASWHVPWDRTAIRAYCTVHPQALYTAANAHDLARAGVDTACSHADPGCRTISVPVCVALIPVQLLRDQALTVQAKGHSAGSHGIVCCRHPMIMPLSCKFPSTGSTCSTARVPATPTTLATTTSRRCERLTAQSATGSPQSQTLLWSGLWSEFKRLVHGGFVAGLGRLRGPLAKRGPEASPAHASNKFQLSGSQERLASRLTCQPVELIYFVAYRIRWRSVEVASSVGQSSTHAERMPSRDREPYVSQYASSSLAQRGRLVAPASQRLTFG